MKYVCKRRPDDGYSCVNIYAGSIRVAVEAHSLSSHDKGEYRIAFLLPEIETIWGDEQRELRKQALSMLDNWFARACGEE